MSVSDRTLCQILLDTQTIAVVGHSDKPTRVSYQIAQFLRQVGYRVIPVNPQIREIEGETCYASLREIPERVDLVNVFRRSEFLAEIVEEAIAINAATVWAQLGIQDEAAAQTARNAGINTIMNACIKIEYQRLGVQKR
ncbi:CoA-binding protein [Desertifilum sp. FACHB-1129]|uniref:CoA-binding protein n=2 Tax=Desertifilum tharense IPPAS B-1220 TaxID=1781255 RepID=A0A1E5QIK3_9CYAN|nr:MULTISPECIES: CoA-binding protein [Desertifilum]MDA0210190.1 CoA-binding protein [Cyanobacteria bacterium FC1]MBD2313585.1 CoA-binding protein [Desertifilum sp. FACHB-1129]MBD2320594.1 CoA-binding protein [Desertifilum sp. FACHB-866]MBD2330722.1 CoA-binding protein [Desertifilum sp. FACHB-868]OEJ74516.1 CoA-binding protein [Desertifilum tharense IPPAS B-1220]